MNVSELAGEAGSRSMQHVIRLVSVSAVAVLLAAISGCGGPDGAKLRSEADKALQSGDVVSAEEGYRAVLEANPVDAIAHGRLGQIAARNGNRDAAMEHFDKAIALDPNWALPYIEKCRMLLAENAVSEAEALAGEFAGHDTENGTILQALVMRHDGRVDDAVRLLEAKVAENGASAPLRVNLGVYLLAADRAADAETQLREVLDTLNPDSTSARMWLVESIRRQGRLDDVVSEYEEMVASNPNDSTIKIALGMALIESDRADEALRLIQPVAKASPDSAWAEYVLGSAWLASGERSNALRHLENANRMMPGNPMISGRLAMARGEAPVADPATARPADAGESTPAPSTRGGEAGEGDWRTLWNQARLGELLDRREEFLALDDPAVPNVLLMSSLFVANLDLARELIGSVPEDSPVQAFFRAFEALSQQTDQEQAREKLVTLRAALDAWGEDDERLKQLKVLAEAYSMSSIRLRSEAFNAYHKALETWPANGVPLRNLAMMYSAAGMPEFATSAMQRLIDVHGNTPELRGLYYRTCTRGNLDEKAVSFAEATYAVSPTDPEAIATLARLYLRTGEIGGALRVLSAAQADLPDEQPLKVLYAAALVRDGQIDEALAELETAEISAELETTAAEVRAFCDASRGAWESVEATMQAQDIEQISTGSRILLAAAKAALGKRDEAIGALPAEDDSGDLRQTLLRVLGGGGEPSNPREAALADVISGNAEDGTAYAYAMACRGSQLYGRAFDLLRALHLKYPEEPQLLSHTLDVLFRADTIDDRSTVAEELTKDLPDSPEAWAGLARVYGADGDTDAEGEAIKQAVLLAPTRVDLLQQLAFYANRDQDNELALDVYRQLLALEPDSVTVLNNFAYYILENDGNPAEAEQYAARALEILPGNPNIMHTVGLAQFEQGKMDEASQHLSRALRMRPGDPTLTFDYGRLLMRQGKDAEGLNYVRLALTFAVNLGLDFPRQDEAVAVLSTARPVSAPPA